MEITARRKSTVKDKSEPFSEVEVFTGSSSALWRSWTFCLLLACIISITAGLWGHLTSYGSTVRSRVSINGQQISKLPAITSEEMGIPIPDPMPSIYVQDAVLFPDHVMLLVKVSKSLNLEGSIDSLECRFGGVPTGSIVEATSPVISIKPRTKDLQMVRCDRPDVKDFPSKLHNNVTLGIRESDVRVESSALYDLDRLPSWEALVYESLVDSDSLVLLAKGLVTKSSRRIDVNSVKCVLGTNLPSEILFETPVLTAAQEVIRCEKPPAHMEEKLKGSRLSVRASWLGVLPSVTYYSPDNRPKTFLASFLGRNSRVDAADELMPSSDEDFQIVEEDHSTSVAQPSAESLASYERSTEGKDEFPKLKLCACTMVWNKAQFIREWVTFHSFMGVEKYFVYDNDSDDDTEGVLNSLSEYNISSMIWPWIKTQQAAFSHCTILARDQCEWMLFSDVDEYIYPRVYLRNPDSDRSDANVLHRMIDNESRSAEKKGNSLGQLQFECNNFGPSGLRGTPKQGVTVGYTCRMRNPQRHKSIIKLASVESSLLNVLHHFELQEGYRSVKINRRDAVVNHYKFQAWDAFKMKFVRRAGTYTTDWQKAENRGSKDRTPGLGTVAVKPDDWESRFCEMHDTGLRHFSLQTFSRPGEPGRMTWQVDPLPIEEAQ